MQRPRALLASLAIVVPICALMSWTYLHGPEDHRLVLRTGKGTVVLVGRGARFDVEVPGRHAGPSAGLPDLRAAEATTTHVEPRRYPASRERVTLDVVDLPYGFGKELFVLNDHEFVLTPSELRSGRYCWPLRAGVSVVVDVDRM
ncbi:MAG TPA: hypothetical protein VGN26_11295 [Armatimonadota bacterium]